jgi:hypothetical protein
MLAASWSHFGEPNNLSDLEDLVTNRQSGSQQWALDPGLMGSVDGKRGLMQIDGKTDPTEMAKQMPRGSEKDVVHVSTLLVSVNLDCDHQAFSQSQLSEQRQSQPSEVFSQSKLPSHHV